MGDNWVHKYNNLKKLHKLVTRYIEEKLGQSLSELDPPDLNAIAKEGDPIEVLKLCELVIAIAVQCQRNQYYIQKIQSLPQTSQHALMLSLEQDELLREKEEMGQRIRDLEQLTFLDKSTGKSRVETLMRTELDHLRTELQKSEERRQEQELIIHNQMKLLTDFSRSETELRLKADEAARLKDQLEEHKHAMEKLQKTENVIEKYKKKLAEGADLRRQMKVIEEQNHDLLERNKVIEEEYRKALAYKSLIESCKEQIVLLEDRNNALVKDKVHAELELRQQGALLQQLEAARTRDVEQIHVLEEAIKELEFSGGNGAPLSTDLNDGEIEGTSLGGQQTLYTTSLKLKIIQLERELEALKEEEQSSSDSKMTVLQHILEGVNKSKSQIDQNELQEHQDKIETQGELDSIQTGDGSEKEVASVLRAMLNTCEKSLVDTKNALAEKDALLAQTTRELLEAKTDLQMLGPDRLKALADWKASRSKELSDLREEHEQLQQQVTSLQQEIKYLSELNRALTGTDKQSQPSMDNLHTKRAHPSQGPHNVIAQKGPMIDVDASADGYSQALTILKSELMTKEDEVESLKGCVMRSCHNTNGWPRRRGSAFNGERLLRNWGQETERRIL
ncbi:hypothetical protein BGZ94_001498 [Podila epigama]|nr:hypothetical protein BGZ94_001498 [Podila epigama]